MPEYIEREALLQAMQTERDSFRPLFDNYAIGFEEGMRNVRIFPSADVAPVRHGRWVLDEKRYVIYCSECGEVSSYSPNIRDVYEENHYCPNCGAKMEGGAD